LAIFEGICTKFNTRTKNRVPVLVSPSKLICDKVKDGGVCHLDIHIFGHNSAVIAYIYTKFETDDGNGAAQQDSSSKFTSAKIERGSCRHFPISFIVFLISFALKSFDLFLCTVFF